jgi:hypothetical protein
MTFHMPDSERLSVGLERKPNGCLEWTNSTTPDGYGHISIDGKLVYTHRFAWTLVNGPIPGGMCILHHCDNPPCCETAPTEGYPEGHLFLGTKGDNMADKVAKGRARGPARRSHCPARHALDERNTYVDSRGYRSCRLCHTLREQIRRAKA